jgi:L-ascorbate metabolism protein UlaG (beta-lactamase superfamily)
MITPSIALRVVPAELSHWLTKSGTVLPTPSINVTAVKAKHSSLLVWKNPTTDKNESHLISEAVVDMKFISEYYKPDVVLVLIGGNFTMGPEDAAFEIR